MISIDFSFLIQLVNFGILVLILNVFLYKPIRKVLAERAEQISGAKAKAVEVDQQVQEKIALYEARMREVKAKAAEERGAMVKAAQAEETVLLEKARSEAASTLSVIRNRVAMEAGEAKEILREQARALSHEICEKVLGRSL